MPIRCTTLTWLLVVVLAAAFGLVGRAAQNAAQPPKPAVALNQADAKSASKAAKSAPSRGSKAEPVDQLCDPLPPGARLRLGTLRFQPAHGAQDMVLSPDNTAAEVLKSLPTNNFPSFRHDRNLCLGCKKSQVQILSSRLTRLKIGESWRKCETPFDERANGLGPKLGCVERTSTGSR